MAFTAPDVVAAAFFVFRFLARVPVVVVVEAVVVLLLVAMSRDSHDV